MNEHLIDGSAATSIFCRLLDFIISRQPSNSRTMVSVHNDLRLQASIMVYGRRSHLSLSTRTVTDYQLRQVTVQARQPTSTAGPLTDFNLCRSQHRLAPNHGVRTTQAGRRWTRGLRHTTKKQDTTTPPVLRSRDLRPWEDVWISTRRIALHLQRPTDLSNGRDHNLQSLHLVKALQAIPATPIQLVRKWWKSARRWTWTAATSTRNW